MNTVLEGKIILVTGGTGSFGQAFIRWILTYANPAKVIVFSRDEWKQWEMRSCYPLFEDKRLRYFLGDIRDRDRLKRALKEVDIVIHAAALKQVPAAEYNPSEFVKTNINGALNLIDMAIDCGVKKVIALSTDKAVNPINLYGATKLCAEKVCISANAYVGHSGSPQLSVVRYGNVFMSRGSVIPHWQKLIQTGAKELPVTNPKMSRFWITLSQAVAFVIRALEEMRGGEIFVPKIPSMLLGDLASAIAPHLPQKECGLREGEKIHEVLISSEESHLGFEFDDYFMLIPESYRQSEGRLLELQKKGKKLPLGFSYTSDNNQQRMSQETVNRLMQEV